MTRSVMFAATAAGGALFVAATMALTPDFSSTMTVRRAQQAVSDERAAVAAVLASARGSNLLMCALAARAMDQSHWGWTDFRPGYDPRGLDTRAVRETLRVAFQPLHDPAIIETLQPALRDSDPCVRRLAAPLLGRLRHPRAVIALRQALRDSNAETREAAALGLGFAGDEQTVSDLVPVLRDATPEVRIAAAWALGEIESKGALQPLVGALNDADARVRATSAWALGRIEDPEAVSSLARVLRRDTDVDVRRNAAWALGKVND